EGLKEIREGIALPEHLVHLFFAHRTEAGALAPAVVDVVAATRLPRIEALTGLLVLPPVRPELVVLLALGGIAEDFIRFVDLLEASLRRLVVLIDVGVMLARQ